jgi:imidazolonepropionase-like amidohydrolase
MRTCLTRCSSSRFVVASLALLMALTAGVRAQQPSSGAAPSVIVKAARLLDVRAGAYRTSQGIWIDGGRIRQVGAFDEVRGAAPKDITVVDLGHATVLPGLIDAHAHLLAAMDPGGAAADNLILTLTRDSPTRRALLGVAMAREMVEGGFTTVRNVGHSGIDGDVSLRDAIRNGWLPGPRVVAAARKIAPYGGQALPVQPSVMQTLVDLEFLTASNPAEGRRGVLENLRVGADVIKVVADFETRIIDEETMKAIADEAHRVNVRVAVHATTKLGIQSAIAAGVDSIEHADQATDEQFQAMKTKGIVLVPTAWPRDLLPIDRSLQRLPNIDALVTGYLAGARARVDRARKAGVKIAFGSDNWFGVPGKTRGQLTRLVLESLQTSFGMPAADVLRSATVTAAELLNVPGVSGAIDAQSYGDLIAVDGDPLANVGDLEKIVFVMKGGAVIRDDARARPGPQS